MARESAELVVRGLATAPNPFSEAPEGSLQQGDNVVLRTSGMLEPRRGYAAGTGAIQGTKITRLTHYSGQGYFFTDTGHLQTFDTATGNVQADVASGLLAPDSANPIRFAAANKSLFFTTSTGVQKVETSGGVPLAVGAPVPSYLNLGVVSGTSNDWMATGRWARYRAVFARYDANNYLVVGAPTEPTTVTNSSGANRAVSIQVYMPASITATQGWFVQVFRTASTSTSVDPGDECFQVLQYNVTAGDVTNGFVSLTDVASDTFLGSAPLYTNANTGEGIAQSNDLPPLARDLALYRDFMLYANTTQRHKLELAIVGVGSPNGVQVGDTFKIFGSAGSTTFTGAASGNIAAQQFQVSTSGTAAQNIETTARGLATCLTLWFQNNYVPGAGGFTCSRLRADYVSSATGNPGYILLSEVGIGGSGFSVQAPTHGDTAYSPPIGTVTAASDNETAPGRLYYSKEGLPQAVPADNWLDVGAADDPIQRVVVLRETCFIFKRRDGLFVLTGSTPETFEVRPFDPTLRVAAPESVASLANSVFALTTKGVVSVNESGVSPALSASFDRDLASVLATCTSLGTIAFGVGYEQDGLYVLALPSLNTDTACQQAYVFGAKVPGWTRWTVPNLQHGMAAIPWSGGLPLPTERLFLAQGAAILRERKDYLGSDYQDAGGAAISSTVKFNYLTADNPLAQKAWQTVLLPFLQANFTTCQLTVSADTPANSVTVPAKAPAASGTPYYMRFDFPQGQGLSTALQVSLTLSTQGGLWQLAGLGLLFEESSALPRRQ